MRALLSRIHSLLRIVHGTSPVYKPVKIDTILTATVQLGAVDQINLIASDINPEVLLAQLIQKNLPDGLSCADIYYAKTADKATQRVCIAKEIIHIFDTEEEKTTVATIERLLDDLCVDGSFFGNPQMLSEKRALYGAIELLVPYEARLVLKGSWMEAKYDMRTLAAAFAVPEHIMRMALNDSYNEEIRKIREELGLALIE